MELITNDFDIYASIQGRLILDAHTPTDTHTSQIHTHTHTHMCTHCYIHTHTHTVTYTHTLAHHAQIKSYMAARRLSGETSWKEASTEYNVASALYMRQAE